MLIRDRLDAAFETEPPEVPVEERVAVGRSALRRRRVGQGVLSVAAVALICTGAVAIVGRGPDAGERLEPSQDRVRTTTSTPEETDNSNDNGGGATTATWPYPEPLAYVDADGALHVVPRARVIEKIPLHVPPGASDDGDLELALEVGRNVWWVSMSYQDGKAAIPSQTVGPIGHFDRGRFHDYVIARRGSVAPHGSSSGSGSSEPPGSAIRANLKLVRFEGDTLIAEDGYTIGEQRPDPGFKGFNADGVPVGVAEVRDADGTRWFVIARAHGNGTTENISARPGTGPVPSDLDGFIAWARHRYDSGVGLL